MADLTLAKVFVDLQLKGKLADYLNSEKARIQNFDAALANGRYAKYAQAAKKINDINTRQAKSAHFQDLAAQYGKVGGAIAAMGEKAKVVAEAMYDAKFAIAGGIAGITALAGAASPDALNTLTGSILKLSIALGGPLTPMLKNASRGIQGLAGEWEKVPDIAKAVLPVAVGGALAGAFAGGRMGAVGGPAGAIGGAIAGGTLAFTQTSMAADLEDRFRSGLKRLGFSKVKSRAELGEHTFMDNLLGRGTEANKISKDKFKESYQLVQPSYTGIEDARKQFQMAVGATGPQERDNLQAQMAQNAEFHKDQMGVLEQIRDKPGGMNP